MISRWRTFWIINGTLLIAIILTLFPLPNWAEALRPHWVALVLIYWTIALPTTVGLATGFVFGLILDIALGNLLGQHALGLSLVSYLVIKNHQRLRIVPLVQQGFIIMFILMIEQLLFLWIYGITNRAPGNLFVYFLPSVTSMLVWPWISILIRDIRRRLITAYSPHF